MDGTPLYRGRLVACGLQLRDLSGAPTGAGARVACTLMLQSAARPASAVGGAAAHAARSPITFDVDVPKSVSGSGRGTIGLLFAAQSTAGGRVC